MKVTKVSLFMVITGTILLGLSIAILRFIDLGTDPFSAMNLGLSKVTGFSYGITQLLVNIFLLIFQIAFARKTIGIGSVANLVFLAFISDFFLAMIEGTGLVIDGLPARLVVLVFCLALLSFSMSLYITSGLGVAPYDALAIFLPEKTPIPFRFWRIITDGFCLIVAFLTGSVIGIGTVAIVLLTGPCVQWFSDKVAKPLKCQLEIVKA